MTIKSSSSLWYWHVLSLVCPQPWNTTWHCFYPMDPKARAKIAGIVNKFYRCIFSFQGVGKNKIADRFLHLLNRPREYIQLHRYKAVFKSYNRWCPSNSCQSHKMFFLFEVKCDWQSTSSFFSPTQTRRNKTLSEQANVQNKRDQAFSEKSSPLLVLVKKEVNFCDDVHCSAVYYW